MLKGKTIILGICGGIAAYKAAALCSRLAQAGADVHVIMTESARQFVAPLTFQALSKNRVSTSTFEEPEASLIWHIELADRADLAVVAPATANVIGKLASGIADDMLTTTLLAVRAPVLIAPAMNVNMYTHPAVADNRRRLAERGVRFIEPGEGQLACGWVGRGRLAEPEQIFEAIEGQLSVSGLLRGRKLLVTAGGTMERLDPVRYIGNDSSGKMGIAVAEAARDMGAEVVLVKGRTTVPDPSGVLVEEALTSGAMRRRVLDRLEWADAVVMAAAVSDYRPAVTHTEKIKKKQERLALELVRTEDILLELGQRRTRQYIVGFAAETGDLEQRALDKIRRKGCDLLVANDVTLEGAGFGTDTNIVKLVGREGVIESLPLMSKRQVAERLLRLVGESLDQGREV